MNIAQPNNMVFLAAVRNTSLETLVTSGNPQLLEALKELNRLR
jgi:hypothetical protein